MPKQSVTDAVKQGITIVQMTRDEVTMPFVVGLP